MTLESTRLLGQPNEIKPPEGAVGGDGLVTLLVSRGLIFEVLRQSKIDVNLASARLIGEHNGPDWNPSDRRF